MRHDTAATDAHTRRLGLIYGLIGVIVFGLTLPVTRIAVKSFSAEFIAFGRVTLAGTLGAVALILTRQPVPDRADWGRFARVALGVGLGFPLLATIAMKYAPASHGGVVLAVLPLATAAASVVTAGERPSLAFWLTALAGSVAVLAYVLLSAAGSSELHWADLLLAGAIVAASIAYAESGVLARRYGGWQVISWALAAAAPAMAVAMVIFSGPVDWHAGTRAWGAFLYLAVMSQFVGFFAWNVGLAMGGIARVGQLQLLQTFVTLLASGPLLGEHVGMLEIVFSFVVVGLVGLGWRTRVSEARPVRGD